MEQVRKAFEDLYGDWSLLSENARVFIEAAMENGNFAEQYAETMKDERETNRLLSNFEQQYPNTVNSSNVDEILSLLRANNK